MERFGFVFEVGGVHLARTMMVDDLRQALSTGGQPATVKDFSSLIQDDNILGKRSTQSRKLAFRHLSKLYGLDVSVGLFRAFRFLYEREPEGQPLLCLLLAYSRDAILRASAPFIFALQEGEPFVREELEAFIDDLQPGRFSKATLKSTAQNLAGTWTQSGHLAGRVKKVRRHVTATPASVSYALLLGFLKGERGELLFECESIKLLDCSSSRAIELAEQAARQGWITLRRIGSVIEVAFPRLLTPEEVELIREQD